MVATAFLSNPMVWMGSTFFFAVLFLLAFFFIIYAAKKTHMVPEIKGAMKGWPIALYFLENRYCEWVPEKPEAGIIQNKDYGAFIINDKATYIDKRTKAVLLPFDASFAGGVNIHAAKLSDDLSYIVRDEEQMKMLREAIATNSIDETTTITALKTTVSLGAIKNMTNALIPHNINAKIEKIIAERLKNYGNINVPQIALLFCAMLGAILLGALIIRMAFKK
jgi:hypothetical protein